MTIVDFAIMRLGYRQTLGVQLNSCYVCVKYLVILVDFFIWLGSVVIALSPYGKHENHIKFTLFLEEFCLFFF